MSKGQNELLRAALARRKQSQQRNAVPQDTAKPIAADHEPEVAAPVEQTDMPAVIDDEPMAGPIADTKVKQDKKLHAKLLEVDELQQVQRESQDREEKSKQPKKKEPQFKENLVDYDLPDKLYEAFDKVHVGTDRVIVFGPRNALEHSAADEVIAYIEKTLLEGGVVVQAVRGAREGRYRAIAIKTV